MNTKLEKDYFKFHWAIYLRLIEDVGFKTLNFHKLFIYSFDLRPNLYKAIEAQCYFEEARLKDHCLFNSKFIDVRIHTKFIGYEK